MVDSLIRIGGAMIFWSLAELSQRSTLAGHFSLLGLDKFVPDPRPAPGALRDALHEALGGPRMLVRRLATKDGFALVEETRGREENAYVQRLAAKLQGTDLADLRIVFSPLDDRAPKVLEAFNKQLGYLTADQIRDTLITLLYTLNATALRKAGGLYWLPESQVGRFEEIARAVEGSAVGRAHAIYIMRHAMDESAVRAVSDAIVAEITGEATRIDNEVSEQDPDKALGVRGLQNRQQQAEQLREKIRQYENLLGMALDGLHQAVDTAELAASRAVLLASAAQSQEVAAAS